MSDAPRRQAARSVPAALWACSPGAVGDGSKRQGRHREATAVTDVTVAIRRLDATLPLPSYAHVGDAGADLHAAADVTLAPGQRALVGTGVACELPQGYAGFVHPRSGLAARHGVTVLNAPGTVDAGYRGEIKVNLVNTDVAQPVTVQRGDRIAQLVVQAVAQVRFHEVDSLPDAPRGADGHGSTGGFRASEAAAKTAGSHNEDGE